MLPSPRRAVSGTHRNAASTGEDVIAKALGRIAAEDAALQAWTYVDAGAGECEVREGPLSGVPFGVKDVIEVAGMPIGYGLPGEARISALDAWCVASLRAAGAVPLGKTHTTAYAHRDPAPTYNPLDRARTPGGSSAGSAAAVAAGHVPFALGTQTIGSVLRPAAYCGVVGFKPTWGRIPTAGVVAQAPSLDHVGVIAADVATASAAARAMIPDLADETLREPRLALAGAVADPGHAPETRATILRAIEQLRAGAFSLATEPMLDEVGASLEDAHLVNAYEGYATLAPLLSGALPPELAAMLRRGAAVPRGDYLAAIARRETLRARVEAFLGRYDAVIVPCGDAAPSRATTGDGSAFGPWTYFGTPAISLPIPGTAPASVSLQLVAPRGADARLLAVAARIAAALAHSELAGSI
jgi:Asp-tRNA(Asn)/Glu-tRNA(Gln) amidotransferase A subunit family amidase